VYTVRFAGLIYVLHAFQKKSKKGIETPKQTIEVIKSRLRDAEEDYRARKEGERKPWARAGGKSKLGVATFLLTWGSPTPRTCC
jgi:hypothetical protein